MIALVHAALDMLGNVEKTGSITFASDIAAHVYVLAGFMLEGFAAANCLKHIALNSNKLADGGGKPVHVDKTVQKQGDDKPGEEEHQGNRYYLAKGIKYLPDIAGYQIRLESMHIGHRPGNAGWRVNRICVGKDQYLALRMACQLVQGKGLAVPVFREGLAVKNTHAAICGGDTVQDIQCIVGRVVIQHQDLVVAIHLATQ